MQCEAVTAAINSTSAKCLYVAVEQPLSLRWLADYHVELVSFEKRGQLLSLFVCNSATPGLTGLLHAQCHGRSSGGFLHHLLELQQRYWYPNIALHFLEKCPWFKDTEALSADQRAHVRKILNVTAAHGTPLLFALTEHLPVVRWLLRRGDVDISAAGWGGRTAAHEMARLGDGAEAVELLQALAARNISVLSAPDANGRPPVIYSRSIQAARFLLDATKVRASAELVRAAVGCL